MTLTFFEYDSPRDKQAWDDFIKAANTGSIHQCTAWRDFQRTIPGRNKVHGFGVKQNNQIKAVTWCVEMQTGLLGKHWYYSARGPVISVSNNEEIINLLLTETSKKLSDRGGIFWRLDPYWSESDWDLLAEDFPKPTQTYQPTDTLKIDLTVEAEDILSQMKQRGRRGIKTALKSNVTTETIVGSDITDKDLDDWYKLATETTGRDGFSGHEKSYYKNFLNILAPHAVLFFSVFDKKRIAAAISTFHNDKAIYYFGASTSDRELNKLKAPTLLQWEMMQYGKAQECSTYDFLGIAPEDEPNHAYAGITQFKNGFGGYRQTYSPGREIVLHTMWHKAYRLAKKIKR